jgi:hypothetical protein
MNFHGFLTATSYHLLLIQQNSVSSPHKVNRPGYAGLIGWRLRVGVLILEK